jgi:Cys-rich protein (TIGR01571 family)
MNETFRAKVLRKTQVAKAELVATAQSLSISKSDPLMKLNNASNQQLQFDIPTGRWRDGIFDCCIMPFHPVFLLTYCWPMITLGQVMTRIKFNVCGGSDNRSNRTCPRAFYIMLAITIVSTIIQGFFTGISQVLTLLFSFGTMFGMGNNLDAATAYNPYAFPGSSSGGGAGTGLSDDLFASIFNGTTFDDDAFQQMIQQQQSQISNNASGPGVPFLGMGLVQILLMLSLFIFMLVVHTKTRNRIRRAYSIGNNTFWLGDCCCAFWCGTCSICQMARHTANYHNTHRARCCTPTGLDEEWDDYDFFTVAQDGHHPPRSVMPMMV